MNQYITIMITILFPTLFSAVAMFVLFVGNAEFDIVFDIGKGKNVRHWLETTFLGFVFAGLELLRYGVTRYGLKIAVTGWLIMWPIRWIVFDPYLNLRRKFPFNYIGELTPKSSMLDKLLHLINRKINGKDSDTSVYQFILKAFALAVIYYLNFLIYKYL